MKDIYRKVLNEICLDSRIEAGSFDIYNPDHIDVMREYMIKIGIPDNIAISETNKLMEKGQHPERQAYNKNGILVTFPTEDHKQKALSAGTHFEKDPTKPQPNITFDQPTNSVPTDTTNTDQTQKQDAAPQLSSSAAPPENIEPINTPQEKMATSDVIKQILRSDDSVLEETSKCLERDMPSSLISLFRR